MLILCDLEARRGVEEGFIKNWPSIFNGCLGGVRETGHYSGMEIGETFTAPIVDFLDMKHIRQTFEAHTGNECIVRTDHWDRKPCNQLDYFDPHA